MNLTKMRHARDRRRRPRGILAAPEGTTAEFYEQFYGALKKSRLSRQDPRWDIQVVTNGLSVELATFRSEPKQ